MAPHMIAIPFAIGSEINLLVRLINRDGSFEQCLVLGMISSDTRNRMVKLNITMCKVGVERLAI